MTETTRHIAYSATSHRSGWLYRFAKRTIDLTAGTLMLLVAAPAIIISTVLSRLTMGTPVFFVQGRPGLYGRLFNLVKFRTMREAFDEEGELLADEKRLTRTGKLMRRYSVDELPQLLNVIKGDMSLVGPRPLLADYLPLYSKEQARRHLVKPGITGWAQVCGRNETTWEDRLAQDVWYVDNCSLWLDFKILFLTIIKVLRREGISQSGHATMPRFMGTESGDQAEQRLVENL